MVCFLGMILIWGSHPVMFMGGLFFILMFLLLNFYFMMKNLWIGYLLALIMLSGILVIFSYMLSLIPNLSFENFKIMMPFLMIFICMNYKFDMFFCLDLSSYCYLIWLMKGLEFMTFYLVSMLLLLMVVVLLLSVYGEGSLRIF